jgi:hypothetical protein
LSFLRSQLCRRLRSLKTTKAKEMHLVSVADGDNIGASACWTNPYSLCSESISLVRRKKVVSRTAASSLRISHSGNKITIERYPGEGTQGGNKQPTDHFTSPAPKPRFIYYSSSQTIG